MLVTNVTKIIQEGSISKEKCVKNVNNCIYYMINTIIITFILKQNNRNQYYLNQFFVYFGQL